MKRAGTETAMILLLLLLMAYSLIGEVFHEFAGTAAFLLFLWHHFRNRGWYRAFFRGGYPARRLFTAMLDLLLLIWMILQPLSGLLISKCLYVFIRVPWATSVARETHLILAYWGFLLLSVHTGAHLPPPMRRLAVKGKKGKFTASLIAVLWTGAALYGCRAFVHRRFADYLFGRAGFVFLDFNEPRIFFFLDYIAAGLLFAGAGCLIVGTLDRIGKKKISSAADRERV